MSVIHEKQCSFTSNVFYDIIIPNCFQENNMDGKKFILSKIDGEYAYLSPIDGGDDIFIALALLPPNADIGSLLICNNFSFETL